MIDENNLKIIDASNVPYSKFGTRSRPDKYHKVFEQIPKGKVGVLNSKETNVIALRCSLTRAQKKGKFKQLTIRQIKDKIYIINNPAEVT